MKYRIFISLAGLLSLVLILFGQNCARQNSFDEDGASFGGSKSPLGFISGRDASGGYVILKSADIVTALPGPELFKLPTGKSAWKVTIKGFNYAEDTILYPLDSNPPSALAGGVNDHNDGDGVDLQCASEGNLNVIYLRDLNPASEIAITMNASLADHKIYDTYSLTGTCTNGAANSSYPNCDLPTTNPVFPIAKTDWAVLLKPGDSVTADPAFNNKFKLPTEKGPWTVTINGFNYHYDKILYPSSGNVPSSKAGGVNNIMNDGAADLHLLDKNVDENSIKLRNLNSESEASIQLNAVPEIYIADSADSKPISCSNGLSIASYPSCTCSAGQEIWGGKCVTICTAPATRNSSGICEAKTCTNGAPSATYPSCTCGPGQENWNSKCVAICTAPATRNSSGVCAAKACANGASIDTYPTCTCSGTQDIWYGNCVAKCTPPQTRNDLGVCQAKSSCSNGLSIASYPSCTCSAGQEIWGGKCVTICTAPATRNSSGVCEAKTCTNGAPSATYPSCTCGPGQENWNSKCVAICTAPATRNSSGVCITQSTTHGSCGVTSNSCGIGNASNLNNGNCGGSATWSCSGTDASPVSCSFKNPDCSSTVASVCTFSYNAWDACQSDGKQYRSVAVFTGAKGCTGAPEISRSCIFYPIVEVKSPLNLNFGNSTVVSVYHISEVGISSLPKNTTFSLVIRFAVIKLDSGLKILESKAASTGVELVLQNGVSIKILNADTQFFQYAGNWNGDSVIPSSNYTAFLKTLGYASVPVSLLEVFRVTTPVLIP